MKRKEYKTIEEWFSHFESDIKTKALRNYKKDSEFSKERTYNSLEDALGFAFSWSNSPENFSYWNKLHSDIRNNPDKYTNSYPDKVVKFLNFETDE